jgi:hypothetical protein
MQRRGGNYHMACRLRGKMRDSRSMARHYGDLYEI